MSDNSNIEWTDATWNPVRGCTKVSPGCKHCYAETLAERFRGVSGHPFEQGFDLRLVPEKLHEPFRWASSRRVFVNSMSDLFHEDVPDGFIVQVLSVMRRADWHIYQILTKRPERMQRMVLDHPWLANSKNIWMGVSVEDRQYGLPRIDVLRRARVALRFLSIEPLLEDLGPFSLSDIDWVIVGGESGPGARPMDEAWVVSIRDRCHASGVPFFFKQWGGVQKARAGRMLHGHLYEEQPRLTACQPPSRAERAARLAATQLVRHDRPLNA